MGIVASGALVCQAGRRMENNSSVPILLGQRVDCLAGILAMAGACLPGNGEGGSWWVAAVEAPNAPEAQGQH